MEIGHRTHPIITARAEDHINRAELLVKFGGNSVLELKRAVQDLHAALGYVPNSSKVFNLLAEVYIRLLDYSSTIHCLRSVIKLDPNHQRCRHMLFELLVLSGLEIFRHGRYYARACYRFSEALKLESSRPKIWTFKAICHVHLREFKDALESTTRAIHTSSPPTADLYVMRAKLLWAEGLVDQGSRDIHAARALDKTHPEVIAFTQRSFRESEVFYGSACRHFQERNFGAAAQDIHMAMMMTPEDVKLYMLLSKTQRLEGNLDEAYSTLQKVKHMYEVKSTNANCELIVPIEVSRQINLIFNEMAIDLAGKGQYDKAIVLFKKLIDSERKIHKSEASMDHRFFINLGDCYRALENGEKALGSYRVALRIKPSNHDVKVRLSMTHYLLGVRLFNDCRYDLAERELSLAIQYNPRVSEYFAVRGKARFYIGDYSAAHEDYLMALELDPSNTDIRDRLRQFAGDPVAGVTDAGALSAAPRGLQSMGDPVRPMVGSAVAPSPQDQVDMMLHAKYVRGTRDLKNHIRGKYHPVTAVTGGAINALEPGTTLCRALLPKLNPGLIPVMEATTLVEGSRRAVTDLFQNNECLTMKRDAVWSLMESAKGSAAKAMKPKHLKKNRKSSLPTTGAAMKRYSLEKSRDAAKTALVSGIVTSKDDEFIKSISPAAQYSNLHIKRSGKSLKNLTFKMTENGDYVYNKIIE